MACRGIQKCGLQVTYKGCMRGRAAVVQAWYYTFQVGAELSPPSGQITTLDWIDLLCPVTSTCLRVQILSQILSKQRIIQVVCYMQSHCPGTRRYVHHLCAPDLRSSERRRITPTYVHLCPVTDAH
jgi:hypothetical protein